MTEDNHPRVEGILTNQRAGFRSRDECEELAERCLKALKGVVSRRGAVAGREWRER